MSDLKVKYSTWLEPDFEGMSSEQLKDLQLEIEAHLQARKTSNSPMLSTLFEPSDNCGTRLVNIMQKHFKVPASEIKLCTLADWTMEDFLKLPGMGKKTISILESLLKEYGHGPIKNTINPVH